MSKASPSKLPDVPRRCRVLKLCPLSIFALIAILSRLRPRRALPSWRADLSNLESRPLYPILDLYRGRRIARWHAGLFPAAKLKPDE